MVVLIPRHLNLFNAYYTKVKKKDEQRRLELSSPHFLLAAVCKALWVCPSQIWASSLDWCPAPFPPLACRGRQNTAAVISGNLCGPKHCYNHHHLSNMKSRRLFFQPCWLPLVFRSFQSSVKKQIMCCFIFSILWCGSRPLTDMSKAPGCCIEVQCIAVQLRIERWLLNSTAVTRSNPEDGQRPNMDVIKIIVGISRLIAFKKLLDTGCCNFMVVFRCKRVWQVTHFSFIVQMCAAGCPNNVCGLCLNYQVFYISLLCFTGTLFWRSGENLNACWDIQAARHRFFFFLCPSNVKKPSHSIIESALSSVPQWNWRNLNLTKMPKQTSPLYLGVDTHWEVIWYSNWGAGWTARWRWYHLDKVPTQKVQCWVK